MGGALAVFLMSMVGIMGMVGATGPNTVATLGAPTVHVSFVVHNDEDTGLVGYWALDNYTKTVTLWNIGGGVYAVNVTYSGTWCTFAGAKSPSAGTIEPTNECGLMTGGYDGTLTPGSGVNLNSSAPKSGTVGGGVFNFGGSEADILKQTYGLQSGDPAADLFSWTAYYFPGTSASIANEVWGWTYTAPNGGGQWINQVAGNTGDIVTSTSSGLIAGANLEASTCALSLSSQVLNFGTILSGQSASASPVTVTNLGTVTSQLSILGDYWRNSANAAIGSPSWTTWSANPGLTGPTPLTGSAVNTNANLAALGGESALTFALIVPSGTATAGAITQQISLVSGC